MVLVVVVKEGDGKKFISGTSVLEIILKAKESFGMTDECPTSDFKLCVTSGEASGLEVEDDDTFNELVKSRKPELLSLEFLSKDKSCSGVVYQRRADREEPSRVVTPQTPNFSRCPPLPMGPLLDDVKPILEDLKKTPEPRNILLIKRRGVRDVSKYCSSFIWKNVRDYTYSTCQSYISALFDYDNGLLKPLFSRNFAGILQDDGYSTLVTSVYNALSHLKCKARLEAGETPRKRRPQQRSVNRLHEEAVDDVEGPEPKRPKYDDYGCVRYNPPLRVGETPASQEEKRQALLRLYDEAENPSEIQLELAKESYESQRSEIVSSSILNLKNVLQRWPHLKKYKCLLDHSDCLLDRDCLNVFMSALGKHSKNIVNYLERFWETSNKVPRQVEEIINQIYEIQESERSHAIFSVALVPLLLHYFKEDSDVFYQLLKFDATDEEVLAAASKANLNPTIIVKGTSLYQAEKFYVVLLNSIMIEVSDFLEATLLSFLCFYVFGVKYPKQTQVTLEFIQRTLLEINPDKHGGDKREIPRRGKGPKIDHKLIKLSEAIRLQGMT